MAEPLKNSYGPEIPQKIAAMIAAVAPKFPVRAFLADALRGYHALELMPRGRHIAHALARHLPADYKKAIDILLASLGPVLKQTKNNGMAPFLYMPHTFFVAEHGLNHVDLSLKALYELTQRFTGEFSIRPFLIHHRDKTLRTLEQWTADRNEHVRRLVSEGTRPRLPWAPRLPEFQKNPRPVLSLLEKLKDDPSDYVRRSVANNLNDIGKDNPDLLYKTTTRWMKNASRERRGIVRHALRSAIKQRNPAALKILGFATTAPVKLKKSLVKLVTIKGRQVALIQWELKNNAARPLRCVVDLRIHYRKARGKTSPKVFKVAEQTWAGRETTVFRKQVSLEAMTTRKHYPGRHHVEALINGKKIPLGFFDLKKPVNS